MKGKIRHTQEKKEEANIPSRASQEERKSLSRDRERYFSIKKGGDEELKDKYTFLFCIGSPLIRFKILYVIYCSYIMDFIFPPPWVLSL